jgi:hypothetical protein
MLDFGKSVVYDLINLFSVTREVEGNPHTSKVDYIVANIAGAFVISS